MAESPDTSGLRCVALVAAGAEVNVGLPLLGGLADRLQVSVASQEDRKLIDVFRRSRYCSPKAIERAIHAINVYAEATRVLQDPVFRELVGFQALAIDPYEAEADWKRVAQRAFSHLHAFYGSDALHGQEENIRKVAQVLETLAKLNNGRLQYYTLNYSSFSRVMAQQANSAIYLNQINPISRHWEESLHPINPFADPSLKIEIYQLHGSVDWERLPNGRILELQGEAWPAESANPMCIKLVSEDGTLSNPPFRHAYHQFYRALEGARVLIVWGFSFRDTEAVRAINYGCSVNPNLRLCYIDSNLSERVAMDHVHNAFTELPVDINPRFVLHRVPWRASDGLDALPSLVEQFVMSLQAE